nr:probable cytochrome P450 313a3 [Drosophila bipectinata]
MRGECCNIIQGATNSTAATVNHILILLAMFPQYQEIVFEELKYVFPAGVDFEVEYADLQKLEYLDRVFRETLRLIPSVTTIIRDLKEDIRLSNNVVVPKGVVCMVDIFHIHRNKDYWGPNAETFNPDNFLDENRTKYMDKYGSTILTWIGITPVILSRDPRIAEDVLSSSKFLNRNSRVTKAMENIFGLGLVTLQGVSL